MRFVVFLCSDCKRDGVGAVEACVVADGEVVGDDFRHHLGGVDLCSFFGLRAFADSVFGMAGRIGV